MTGNLLNRARHIVALFGVLILTIHSAFAETVEARLPTGIVASADFRAGQTSRPAVLLLHGFLQTRHVPPMSSLANTLADQGYTVLTPTLTLGINRRSKSLGCEAVHTHTLEEDIAEIRFWVNWLARKGYGSITLIGHSFGSTQILYYLTQKPNPAAKKAILTSLVPLLSKPQEAQKALARVKQARTSEQALERFTLSYCNGNYVAPAAAYLSYVANDSSKTLDQFGKTRVPVEVILGAADTAIESAWSEKIRTRGIPVAVIDKAGHFFDGAQEFDLADKVESILKTLPAGNK
jgi:pimeloyl-ACP methyl ester carboxylesterase